MAEEYQYTKKRTEFGRPAQFEDTDTRIVGAYAHNESQDTDYTPRNPNKTVLDNIPVMSEHRVSYTFLNLAKGPRFNNKHALPQLSLFLLHRLTLSACQRKTMV